jgi:metal-sulfur cluster biosynthetic enzyme
VTIKPEKVLPMPAEKDRAEQVRALLRSVQYPGFDRDIVSTGFVKDIEIKGDRVIVHFAPNTSDQAKVKRMEGDIRDVLVAAGQFKHIDIRSRQPFNGETLLSGGGMTPLQAEMLEDGTLPEADVLGRAMQRPDMAPGAGYGEGGPEPLGGPSSETYEGEVPVFQWEIDPHDASACSGSNNLTIGDWEFRIWWQVHPARLVYASIQAMREDWVDLGGAARSHPVGRSAAVNLVCDQDREAVVAIYGTVQDFRPFVDAFHRGYLRKN